MRTLSLPAQLAILAGDKRIEGGAREDLKAHEILNAAARAGRAGHLANGLVLLIPEPIISFEKTNVVGPSTVRKLRSILPEDDHCVRITDALEVVLDRLMLGQTTDPDVLYVANRFAVLREVEGETEEPTTLFDLNKSLGAFFARKRKSEAEFQHKVTNLRSAITAAMPGTLDNATALLATQSGLSAELLMETRDRIKDEIGSLPTTIDGWLTWTLAWLDADNVARQALLGDILGDILSAIGKSEKQGYAKGDLLKLLPGLRAWVSGQPFRQIEIELGGNPDDDKSKIKRLCPRARELIGSVIPRGLSFTFSLMTKIVKDLDPFAAQPELSSQMIEVLGTAIRKGYDTPEKLTFASQHKSVLSRVQMHQEYVKAA
jgi:hypothetical protein